MTTSNMLYHLHNIVLFNRCLDNFSLCQIVKLILEWTTLDARFSWCNIFVYVWTRLFFLFLYLSYVSVFLLVYYLLFSTFWMKFFIYLFFNSHFPTIQMRIYTIFFGFERTAKTEWYIWKINLSKKAKVVLPFYLQLSTATTKSTK